MKKALILLALAIASVGCGGSAPALETAKDAKIRELEEQNARNERLLRAQGIAAQRSNGSGPMFMVPPVPQHDGMRGVPQNVGSMYAPIKGCEEGSRALAVTNSYAPNHIQLLVDGEGAHIRGARGVMPTLPPGKTAYFCLVPSPHHSITAIAFEPAGLTPVQGKMGTGTIEFDTGAFKRHIYFETADFALSD